MATRRQYLKLGIFTLAVALLLALTIAYVGGRRWFETRDAYYVISDESISGVDVESPVTLRGVKVGEVSAVTLDRSDFGRVRIELAVDDHVAIPAAAQAYFRRTGLTGERAIDITGGTTRDGTLPPGSTIPRGATAIEGLEDRAEAFASDIVVLVQQATALVEQVRTLVAAVEPARVERIVADVEKAAGSLEVAGRELERTVRAGRRGVERVVTTVDGVAGGADGMIGDVRGTAVDLRALVRHVERMLSVNEDDLRATLGHLRRATRNAEQLTRQLRMRPSLLLRSDPPRERELP